MADAGERHQTFPNAVEAFFLVVVLFALEMLVAAALRDAQHVTGMQGRDSDALVVLLGNGLLFSGLLVYKRMSYGALFHPASQSVAATVGILALPVLMLVPGVMLAMAAVNAVIEFVFPMSSAEQAMFDRMMSTGLATVIAVCVLAPILEEMLFRGVILRSFLLQYPPRTAIAGSAALFGLAHLNIYQFVTAFFAGLILGWLYERSRSLWPSILLHAAYNSLITYLYFTKGETGDLDLGTLSPAHWIAAVGLAVAGAELLRRVLVPARRT